MKKDELTMTVVGVRAGDAISPPAAELLWKNGGGVPVVDARGRMTGILITDRDILLSWYAAREELSGGAKRVMRPRSPEAHGNFDLIQNDAALFVIREDGIIESRVLALRGGDSPISFGGDSMLESDDMGAFMRHARTGEGYASRERSEDFEDHYRKATLFWSGLSVRGRAQLVQCARLELGKVESGEAWRRVIAQFHRIDGELARRVAQGLRHPKGAGVLEPVAFWR